MAWRKRRRNWRTSWRTFVWILRVSWFIRVARLWWECVESFLIVSWWWARIWELAMYSRGIRNLTTFWIHWDLSMDRMSASCSFIFIYTGKVFLLSFFIYLIIYFKLIYHFLDEWHGRQNEELLDRVQSSELYLIFLGKIWELIII